MGTKPTTQVFLYNDSPISFQMGEETMINATQMAKPFDKATKDFLKTEQTKELLGILSKRTEIPLADLMIVRKGGNNAGTWMHADIALIFAQWLSPEFYFWCNDRIKELFRFGLTATDEMLIKATTDPEFVMMMIENLKEKRKENIELSEHNRTLRAQIAENASKVEFFDNVKQLNEHDQKRKTFTISKIASDMKLTGTALNRILIRKGVINKINGHMYIGEQYKDCGYAIERITQSRRLNEDTDKFEMVDVTYLVWTQAGREFIIDFLSETKK